MISVSHLDHLVLTVSDVERSVAFYCHVLGMKAVSFGSGRQSVHFGKQKINLHPKMNDHDLVADKPLPGSADLCFVVMTPLEAVRTHLRMMGVPILAGPVRRTGATGPIRSLYFRDPDGNLIEVSNTIGEETDSGLEDSR